MMRVRLTATVCLFGLPINLSRKEQMGKTAMQRPHTTATPALRALLRQSQPGLPACRARFLQTTQKMFRCGPALFSTSFSEEISYTCTWTCTSWIGFQSSAVQMRPPTAPVVVSLAWPWRIFALGQTQKKYHGEGMAMAGFGCASDRWRSLPSVIEVDMCMAGCARAYLV
jgi:hypothetical protein